MKLPKILTSLGLTPAEAEMYLTLIQFGPGTVSHISRESTLHRPAIYAAIPLLREKGLISQRRVGKLIHYSAESPERLRVLADIVHEELDTVIPKLTDRYAKKAPYVRRLDGKVGVHAVYEDILLTLKPGDTYYRFSSENIKDARQAGLPKNYEKNRDKMKLERLVISNPDYIASREPKLEESLRVVPDEFLPFDHHVSQIIYGNKIAFIDFNQPIATIIENETLAKFQTDIFKMLFKKLGRHK